VLITITNTAHEATDLGFLLHKNPANLHSADLAFGKAYVFYSSATAQRCTACLLLELDPVELVRGAGRLEDYVNDRPYVASSYLTVAMGRIFGTALAGNCQKRPELVDVKLPLEVTVEVIRARGGADILRRLFEPLGYEVDVMPIPLDEKFPEWGEGHYFRLALKARVTVHDALSHMYVLLPALDEEKHYYIGDAEVDKLLRHGEGWLGKHPDRQLIIQRYLKRRSSLVDQAMARLLDEENAAVEAVESKTEQAAVAEKDLERPMTLHTQRLNLVATKLKALEAKTILDLGCGEGKLLRRLLADREPNWPSNSVAGLAAFLPARKSKQSERDQDSNASFHVCSRFDFIPLIHSSCRTEMPVAFRNFRDQKRTIMPPLATTLCWVLEDSATLRFGLPDKKS